METSTLWLYYLRMKGKLIYIGSNIPDKTPAAVRVFANALALREYGFDVKIISKDIDYQTEFDQNEGIDTWHLKRASTTSEWISALVDINPYIRIIDKLHDVRVVIAYELPAIAFIKLHHYCKQKGIKLICETAEWQRWENLGYLGFLARTVRLADINLSMHNAYRKSDGVIVTSHYFANYFKNELPVLSLPTLQCYKMGIDDNPIHNHPRKFIYAGNLGYQKDMLSEIIHAFSEIKDRNYELNILGLTVEQYSLQFKDDIPMINSINQEREKIKFWGSIPHTTVLTELMKSDFSLIIRQSSHRNNVGFPTKFGESINCGTPVIVSDFSDVVFYTELYKVGIVAKVNRIKDALYQALDMDEDSLNQMRKRCRECDAFYYKGHVNEIGVFVELVLNN